jgi:hypothetical protein
VEEVLSILLLLEAVVVEKVVLVVLDLNAVEEEQVDIERDLDYQ